MRFTDQLLPRLVCVPMNYDIAYDGGIETVSEDVSREEMDRVQQKLEEIATCEWRSPTDSCWDYTAWDGGQSSGKYTVGGFRIFVDIVEETGEMVVREVRPRENLYR